LRHSLAAWGWPRTRLFRLPPDVSDVVHVAASSPGPARTLVSATRLCEALRRSGKRQAAAGGAGLADESVQSRLNTYAVLPQVPVGGLKSTPFSGKGLVCELTGPRVLRRESGRQAGQNYDSVPKCRHILCLAHHPDCKKKRLIGHTNSELTIKNEGAILNCTF
jgi:hypothetical protein